MVKKRTLDKVVKELSQKHPSEKDRIKKCAAQTAALWRKEDGTEADFSAFCLKNFMTGKDLETLLERFERKYESISGHFTALMLDLRHELDEDTGPMHPSDAVFASLNPAVHLTDDLFKTKLAFLVLLNFEAETLETCLKKGTGWSRTKWAETRLAQRHLFRVPAEISQEITDTYAKSAEYVYGYNIFMGGLRDEKGEKLFPDDLELISHWGLRDHLKTYYSENSAKNLNCQRAVYKTMERIISQDLPVSFVNSKEHTYNPFADELDGKKHADKTPERYRHLSNIFKAHRKEDAYYPLYPRLIDRSFNLYREIPEKKIEAMFVKILTSRTARSVSELIKARLGRALEPFDVWYDGFKSRGSISGEKLDALVAEKYPALEDFQKDIPNILEKLSFDRETAEFLAARIEADPARGAGHAWGPEMKTEKAHLRTRAKAGGKMDYQAFNTAMHELGHCVEQVFSLYRVDHSILHGVPNTAFTEGFAFVFQDRGLEILGLKMNEREKAAMKALDIFWSTMEIAGVALVDMGVWNWMYSKKNFTPEQLGEAVMKTARGVWNKYYAPVFGVKDSAILAVYSHMIYHAIYLPDYPLGHIIAWQVEKFFEKNPVGEHMERMCKIGTVTPREWMRQAVGEDISPEPLIESAFRAAESKKASV